VRGEEKRREERRGEEKRREEKRREEKRREEKRREEWGKQQSWPTALHVGTNSDYTEDSSLLRYLLRT
jgi:hypothetical protein